MIEFVERCVLQMNSKQLQYAIELSKSLNFSQVAEQFGISQPALSKQISNLEKDLGVILFDRKKNPVELTAAGEYFFNKATDLLYREEQLYRSMEEFQSGKMGSLTIGISPFRSLYFIPEICKKVKEKFPGVKIILHEDGSETLRKKASEGKYDFAIANLPVDESVLDIIPIEQDTLVLAVPDNLKDKIKNIPKNNMDKIDFKDLKQMSFVVVGQNQEMRQLFEKICSTANINPKIAMEVVGLSTAWSMACAGIGATLLPLQYIKSTKSYENMSLYIPNVDTNVRQPAIITKRGQYISQYAKYAIELLTK